MKPEAPIAYVQNIDIKSNVCLSVVHPVETYNDVVSRMPS